MNKEQEKLIMECLQESMIELEIDNSDTMEIEFQGRIFIGVPEDAHAKIQDIIKKTLEKFVEKNK